MMQQIRSHMRINGQYIEFEDLETVAARNRDMNLAKWR